MDAEVIERLTATFKRAAAALAEDEVPYLLAGGLGCWARGGPPSENDIDLVAEKGDAETVLATLERIGMRVEYPPEQWLFKAWDDDVLIDVIFAPAGLRMSDAVLERGDVLNVDGMYVPVMALDDILVTKLFALDEHACDYENLLAIARSLREQIGWADLRERTATSPFARAFFVLADGLGISNLMPSEWEP